eukprot:TRINITY_DN4765_c0_g1_i1.p1 TRINITY_DN4765_c0_g1~~TRINITY_DN4765_c0_g1_i1.p1  ORF type:complete len:403 (+),score=85.76 TRINITY_DN4765_c0_g1_i1:62-1270(+)
MSDELCPDEVVLNEVGDDDDDDDDEEEEPEMIERVQTPAAITSIVVTNSWGGCGGVAAAVGLITVVMEVVSPTIITTTRHRFRYSPSTLTHEHYSLGSGTRVFAGLIHQSPSTQHNPEFSFPRSDWSNFFSKKINNQHTTKHFVNICGIRTRGYQTGLSSPTSVREVLRARCPKPPPPPAMKKGRCAMLSPPPKRSPIESIVCDSDPIRIPENQPSQRQFRRTYSRRESFLRRARKNYETAAINLQIFNSKTPVIETGVVEEKKKPSLKPKKPKKVIKEEENATVAATEGIPPTTNSKTLERYLIPVISRLIKGANCISTPASTIAARLAEGTTVRPKTDSLEERLSNVITTTPSPSNECSDEWPALPVPSSDQLASLVADLKSRVARTQITIHKMRSAVTT